MSSLSVIIPTLNCGALIRDHIRSMQPWLDLAAEIIVVDSYSEDNTLEIIRSELRHPNLRILPHPRGLWQSWNYGIAHATQPWTYVSTVGDSMERRLLLHLLNAIERLDCDVVCSKPDFVDAKGKTVPPALWPIDRVITTLDLKEPTEISSDAAFFFALLDAPMGLLGSSASNVYRTSVLQNAPFPTNYGYEGDGAWAIMNAYTTRFAFTPERGSTFRYHPKAYACPTRRTEDIFAPIFKLWMDVWTSKQLRDDNFAGEDLEFRHAVSLVEEYFQKRMVLENFRKHHPVPWVINPKAWTGRKIRNEARVRLLSFVETTAQKIRRSHSRPISASNRSRRGAEAQIALATDSSAASTSFAGISSTQRGRSSSQSQLH